VTQESRGCECGLETNSQGIAESSDNRADNSPNLHRKRPQFCALHVASRAFASILAIHRFIVRKCKYSAAMASIDVQKVAKSG